MREINYSSILFEKLQQQGWDKTALEVYIDAINRQVIDTNQAIFLVGSELYTEMFVKSQLSDQAKIMLVIDHLGGYLDKNGDLQFRPTEYKFCSKMPPGAPFLASYSKAVQHAYPNGLIIEKADKKLTKTAIKIKYANETKIHQFRNQLDRCNIRYVENYKKAYNLKNDETAIKLILKDNWFYADPQYHNRAYLGVDVLTENLNKETKTLTNKGLIKKIRKRGFYRKILSGDYHSEFIIDEQGQLLSQWKEQLATSELLESTIANGESFNYGKRPRDDQNQTHDKLDGNPPRYFDTDRRNQLKRNWLSPKDNWFYQLIRRLSEKGLRYKKKW